MINFGNVRIDFWRIYRHGDGKAPHRTVEVGVWSGEPPKITSVVTIYVSPTGRSVRILRNGRELK